MITVPRMASVLRTVFEKEAPILARQMGVIQRNRKVNGTSLLLMVVVGGVAQPKAGSKSAARFGGTLGVAIRKQGIGEHWKFKTAGWPYEVLPRGVQFLIPAKTGAIPLLQR